MTTQLSQTTPWKEMQAPARPRPKTVHQQYLAMNSSGFELQISNIGGHYKKKGGKIKEPMRTTMIYEQFKIQWRPDTLVIKKHGNDREYNIFKIFNMLSRNTVIDLRRVEFVNCRLVSKDLNQVGAFIKRIPNVNTLVITGSSKLMFNSEDMANVDWVEMVFKTTKITRIVLTGSGCVDFRCFSYNPESHTLIA